MYKIYFYSEPVFLYIDSESIIDLDLRVIGEKKIFEMKYDDYFFDYNLRNSKSKEWSVTIQSYADDGKFILQSNIYGDSLKLRKLKKGNSIKLEYDQITNNKVWASLPPSFEMGEEEYKKCKLSYIRNLKLENILFVIL
jgi:hypothetical protein